MVWLPVGAIAGASERLTSISVESAAGIGAGGRTGFDCPPWFAICLTLSSFFSPLAIVPTAALAQF